MDRRCKYTSKPCYNLRSLKNTGEYHNFCDFHRDKANEAQRRWYMRKTPAPVDKEPKSEGETNVKMEEKTDVKPNKRKISKKCTATTASPPRKRGRVTFRDASKAAVALASVSSPSSCGSTSDEDLLAFADLYEPYLASLQWDEIELSASASAEPIKMEYDWPFQVSIASPGDAALTSLFTPVAHNADY